jgi:hypothetical protein
MWIAIGIVDKSYKDKSMKQFQNRWVYYRNDK